MKTICTLFIILLTSTMMFGQEDSTKINNLNVIELNGVRACRLTPVTQKTLSREEIQLNYHGEEVSQIIDETPAITSNTDGGNAYGYTYFRMRGMDQARINMTLNGVPLNEPEDQGVYFSNYPNFMGNIKSLQIQRGVGTSSNGVASYAGSLNFTSPNGWEKYGKAELNYGSNNTKRLSVMYSSGLSDKNLAIYVSESAFTSDGYRYESGSKGFSGFVSGGYFGEKDIIKFTTFIGNSKGEMAWLAVSEEDIENDPRTNYNVGDGNDNFKQGMFQLNYIRKISPYHTLNTTAYYNKLKGEYDYFGGDTEEPLKLNSDFLGLVTNFNYTKGNIAFDGGVSGNLYERDHTLQPYHSNSGNKNEFSAYSKVNYTLGRFIVYGDIQYRVVKFTYDGDVVMPEQNWEFLNPRVGTTFLVTHNFNIYGYVGKSHREPNRTDLFNGNDNFESLRPLEPEEVIDYELGFNYNTSKFNIQANLYYMDFNNELSLTGALGPNSLPLVGSFDESYRSGIELDVSYQIANNLSIYYNEAHSKNRITYKGVSFEPLYTPDVVRNIKLSYNNEKLNVNLLAKHHSESFIDLTNENVTPAFTIFSANAGYNFTNLFLGVEVVNITSERYYTNGYNYEGVNYFYTNAPISAFGTVGFKF